MFARPIPKLCKCTCVAYGARSLTETGLRWSIKRYKTTQRLQIPAWQSKIRFLKCIFSQDYTPTSIIFKTSSFWCITSNALHVVLFPGPLTSLHLSDLSLPFVSQFNSWFFFGHFFHFILHRLRIIFRERCWQFIQLWSFYRLNCSLVVCFGKTREIWKQYKTMI